MERSVVTLTPSLFSINLRWEIRYRPATAFFVIGKAKKVNADPPSSKAITTHSWPDSITSITPYHSNIRTPFTRWLAHLCYFLSRLDQRLREWSCLLKLNLKVVAQQTSGFVEMHNCFADFQNQYWQSLVLFQSRSFVLIIEYPLRVVVGTNFAI